jgi:hypothetical protein
VHRPISVAVRLLAGLALGWAAFCVAVETRGSLSYYMARGGNVSPYLWRFGMAPVERLARCLAEARELMPAGSVVAFVSPDGPGDADFFRWRWAAYLLPDEDVVRWRDAEGARAGFLITYRRQVDGTALRMLRQLHGGRLYRIGP